MNTHEIHQCKHPKENKFFAVGAFVTILLLSLLFIGSFFRTEVIDFAKTEVVTSYQAEHPATKNMTDKQVLAEMPTDDTEMLEALDYYYWYVIVLVPFAFFLLILFTVGKTYGGLVGNSVRLDEHQYPQVHKMFTEMARELGFEEIPELYLVSGNGTLNAYATCVPGYRNFSAIYSDILERCLRNDDMDTLRFILGHELGHIKFNHVKWWYHLATFWTNLPFVNYLIGLPMSRSRELGCDKVGEKLSGDSTGRPLMMLSAGKYAYQDIDMEHYTKEHFDKPSFWAWLSNLGNDHSLLSWRIAAIRRNHVAGLIFRNKADNRKDRESEK